MNALERLACLGIALAAAACASLDGRVSSVAIMPAPAGASFFVAHSEVPTLGERHMADLLGKEMRARGFVEAMEPSAADLGVNYQFNLGTGTSNVSSLPDYTNGGSYVSLETTYTRFLQVILLDKKASEAAQKPVIIWQAEIFSKGSGSNLSVLADSFVPEIFKAFGRNVTNEEIGRPVVLFGERLCFICYSL